MNRVQSLVHKVALHLAPPNSSRRRLLAAVFWTYVAATRAWRKTIADRPLVRSRPGLRRYGAWRRQERKAAAGSTAGGLTASTHFVVLVETPVSGRDRGFDRTRRSVLQSGANVEVHPVRSGSPLASVAGPIEDGAFLLFLRAGSVLAPGALVELAHLHRADPALRMIVFDSDELGRFGGRRNPRFRPVWAPEALFGDNYIDRAFAVRRSALTGLLDLPLSDEGIWRLMFHRQWNELTVGRLPRMVLSQPSVRRRDADRTAADLVRESLAERDERAEASPDASGVVRVRLQPDRWPTVSVVIPTRHSRGNLGRLLPSLATTDYPAFDIRIMDNGGESDENNAWYADHHHDLDLAVTWWTEAPFNYSRVNNAGVRLTDGEIVVMLNDDTEIVDAGWLKEMVGVLLRDGVGTVGLQHRQGGGLIQHGGVLVGPGGFADNLFSGLRPDSDTLLGRTSSYRNTLAVTGACVAIKRADFEEVGGLDERFILCGSDVVLGLDQIIRHRRNVVIPFDMVRHYESLTRGTAVPAEDFYASYFRYHPWLQGGDPYSSPNVSRLSAKPVFNNRKDVTPLRLALSTVGRVYGNLAQSSSISAEAAGLVHKASVTEEDVEAVHALHRSTADFNDIRTINWFVPDIDMPFFGGLNTAFRLADKFARDHGVVNRFVMMAAENRPYVAAALAAAFPALTGADIVFYDGSDEQIALIPSADAAVATLWLTAPHVAKSKNVKRKFYLMQDFEPGFYPASSMFAMAEESYRLGLFGICNTDSMYRIYTEEYGGRAVAFTPAVDREIYNPAGRREKGPSEPVTIFAYARDHFRNCWELVYAALTEIKKMHGDGVRIIAAGARYLPDSADFVDMGLLDYRATGAVYRETDIGITMQISRHPSYLPLELMASGVAMVAPDSEWFGWLFHKEENSLLTRRAVDDMVHQLDRLVRDEQLRARIARAGLETIDREHSDWDAAFANVFSYMNDPH